MSDKYDIYVLEIARNNEITQICGAPPECCDELRYKKLEADQKMYLNYFLTNDPFQEDVLYGTNRRTLSLYQYRNSSGKGEPFQNDDTSDNSFLILIQICLYAECFQDLQADDLKNSRPDVEAFLKEKEDAIRSEMETALSEAELESIVFRIFRSSTTGDFCLVIRTVNADFAEKASDCLNGCFSCAVTYMTIWKRGDEKAKNNLHVFISEKYQRACEDSALSERKSREMCNRNKTLYERIKKLKDYGVYFAQENRNFQDAFYATMELCRSYAAWEKATEINWRIWCHDLEILCDCIEGHMKTYLEDIPDTEEKKRRFRFALLRCWRESIRAIDDYTRLVLMINYQNFQVPVYGIQTPIAAEKIMVAYREAMRVYYRGYDIHVSQIFGSSFAAETKTEPIIYPSLTKDKVEVTTLFANITNEPFKGMRHSVCIVPSFEYFGRFFDFLPLLMHEAAHSIRGMDRPARNEFLITYAFKHVFQAVISQLLQEPSDANRYENMGTATKDLLEAFHSVAKEELNLDSNANFEQTTDAISYYLLKLFPQETNVTKDFERARKRLVDLLTAELRQDGLLEGRETEKRKDLLDNLQTLKERAFDIETAETLLEIALDEKNEKLKDLLSDRKLSGDELLELNNFCLPAKSFDQKIFKLRNKLEDSKTASILNEYIFSIKKLYRIYSIYRSAKAEYTDPEKRREEFLKKVFQRYRTQKADESVKTLQDPEVMYFLNYMGLLGEDDKIFFRQCIKAFDKISFPKIQQFKYFRTRVYRETCADVMMASSLQLTAFGYCRQILRTISDTMQEYSFDRYDSLDFGRFRTVAALLLLCEQGEDTLKQAEYGEDEYRINAQDLFEKGVCYCENYLKHIRKIIRAENKTVSLDRLNAFLGDINMQIQTVFEGFTTSSYQQTVLYVLLHGGSENLKGKSREHWAEYKDLAEICNRFRRHFWRLECFCIGLHYILSDSYIIVERDFLDHMIELRKNVANTEDLKDSDRCAWEENLWPSMWDAKKKVGEYYNDPKSIDEKSDGERLENTIDFIQNFYYHNRATMVRQGENINGENTASSIS